MCSLTAAAADGVRADLREAQREAWASLSRAGTWWDGLQRHELATTALAALLDPEPPPAWAAPSATGVADMWRYAPPVAHDAVHRVARHAGTLTASWHRSIGERLDDDLAYVELVGIACTVATVATFRRAIGLSPARLAPPRQGRPSRVTPDGLVDAKLNWVQVIGPADRTAAVVQAFTSVPAENERVWRLAAAHYIPEPEMDDPRWSRGTLSRPQMELVAARVSLLQECFY